MDGSAALPGDAAAAPLGVIVIGAGYVGLVTGACLAELGHQVLCVDTDAARIAGLQAGRCPIYEPGLAELIARNTAAGRLGFGARPVGLDQARAIFLAVGTPPLADGGADLSALFEAVRGLAPRLGRHAAVILKSTVPPGTADAVQRMLERLRPDLQPTVVANPEFLREGAAIGDFMAPDRIVVGCATAYGRWLMRELYAPLLRQGAPLLVTGRRSAELIKYASNAFLATKISFINEMADLCEAIGAEVGDVARGVGLDRRIGPEFLQPGPGYGGSCFPKDTQALLASAAEYETHLRVVSGAVAANDQRVAALAARVAGVLGGELNGRRIAVLGLTFKADTDDVRESPALALVEQLCAAGAAVCAYDPRGMAEASRRLGGVELAADAYACAAGAEAIVLATDWPEFHALDLRRLGAAAAQRLLIDLRNALPVAELLRAGFTVHGVGRPLRAPERGGAFTDCEPELRSEPAPTPFAAAMQRVSYATLD